MDIVGGLLVVGVSFGRNFLGIITRPYETYRRIVERGNPWEVGYIGVILGFYFSLASLVKTAAFRPFLLTKQFALLLVGAGGGFLMMVALLWMASRLVGGEGKLWRLTVAWAYTLVPTTIWFFITSLLYVILPPPRTTSVPGVAFSMLFLIFSVTILWWKVTLAYLTLRFAMKLDLARIAIVVALTAPVFAIYTVSMYRLGIFKVPFL